jgi:hypothetical protein
MAIRVMTTKEHCNDPDVEIVTNYDGAEVGRVYHGSNCPLHSKHDLSGKLTAECSTDSGYGRDCRINLEPLYMRTHAVGKVVSLREHNGYHDSDFYATYWDDRMEAFIEVEYASTRGWSYPNNAVVDAPPELIKKYQEKLEADRKRREQAYRDWREQEYGPLCVRGDTLEVFKGRKVPVGTFGVCIWVGPDKFRVNHKRVGIKDDEGTVHWTSASNVKVLNKAGVTP